MAAGTVAGVVGAAAGDGVGRLQLALALAWRRRLLLGGWGLRRQLYVLERLCLGERLRWLPLGLVITVFLGSSPSIVAGYFLDSCNASKRPQPI